MKAILRNGPLMIVLLTSGVSTRGQSGEFRIEQLPDVAAAPGQMIQLYVAGVSDRPIPPIPPERFEVLVIQNEVTHKAHVKAASHVRANPTAKRQPVPKGEPVNVEEIVASFKPYQAVMFTVPETLSEGEAAAVVIYREKRSNEFKFKVVSRPPAPRVTGVVAVASFSPQLPGGQMKGIPMRGLTFERGKNTVIGVSPLIDPDVPGTAILVTFTQGPLILEVLARVKRIDPAEQEARRILYAPTRYEVTVKTPADLVAGPAEVAVRLRANGQTGDPDVLQTVIVDSSNEIESPERLRPLITNVSQSRVGHGQAFQLSVDDVRRLGPDALKTVVVIEQDSRRVELVPEMNSSKFRRELQSGAVVLAVRVGPELTGKVMVRVYNPARSEEAGMSDGVPIEITEEVLPPVVSRVSEASKQDLAMLSAMREAALAAGQPAGEYDADARYVTIRASGLDYNPKFVRIEFEQGGETFTPGKNSFWANTGDRLIVSLPEGISPGIVHLRIRNLVPSGEMSEAATSAFDVTRASSKR
ncbi:MAG TPA: hypothetical protein VJH03_18180 [Blastocatellia bacterium]|nr:hypothetical protein [Blastocatellia bacterium]